MKPHVLRVLIGIMLLSLLLSGGVFAQPTVTVVGGGAVQSTIQLQLAPVPDAGWVFDHWEGGLTGSADPASIAVDSSDSVRAVFKQLEVRKGSGKIAFFTGRDVVAGEIYLMNADGSEQTRLVSSGGYPLSWSRDGTKMAFGNGDIYVMNSDGSGRTLVPYIGRWSWRGSAGLSPDGSQIAFRSDRGDRPQISVMNADGSGETLLTPLGGNEPSWSPDGRRIAFSSNREGIGDVYVMNADGSEQTRLTSLGRNGAPSWSPDGRQIAFHSARVAGPLGNPDIYVMNADGSGQTKLTDSSAYNSHPSWSPDGRQIAFRSDRDGHPDIYVMNVDGSEVTRLTTLGGTEPSWSPF